MRASNRREVAEALLEGVLSGPAGWLARRRSGLHELVTGIRVQPSITLHPAGTWQVTFSAAPAQIAWEGVLEDTLRILAGVARSHPTSLVIDEFQRCAEIDAGLPGVFKAVADELDAVSLVFAGSKLHIMRELSTGPGAPLLGMGERISLDVIPESDMVGLLCARATDAGKPMETRVAGDVYRSVDGVPNDVQKLAYAAFAAAADRVDDAAVSAGFAEIVSLESVDFAERFERCSPSQQRVLKALAMSATSSVFSHEFLHRVDVANANAVRKALDVLSNRELVRRSAGGVWLVADPFFRAWLTQ